MNIVKVSDSKKRKGFAEWVVKNPKDGTSITVHDTEAGVKSRFGEKADKAKGEVKMEQHTTISEPVTANRGTVKEQILETLSINPLPARIIAERIGRPLPSTRRTLNQLAVSNRIRKHFDGAYSRSY